MRVNDNNTPAFGHKRGALGLAIALVEIGRAHV